MNETLTERIHLSEGLLSGTQNSKQSRLWPHLLLALPRCPVLSLPSQEPTHWLGLTLPEQQTAEVGSRKYRTEGSANWQTCSWLGSQLAGPKAINNLASSMKAEGSLQWWWPQTFVTFPIHGCCALVMLLSRHHTPCYHHLKASGSQICGIKPRTVTSSNCLG
jgi:hypothetical protein